MGTKCCCGSLLLAALPSLQAPASLALPASLHFSRASNSSRKSDYHQVMGLQSQDSKSLGINAISFQNFLTHFLFFSIFPFFFFEKKTRLTFFPICLLQNSLTMIGIFLLCGLSQRPRRHAPHWMQSARISSQKKQCFSCKLVFLMEPAYGPFNRKTQKDFRTQFSSHSIKLQQGFFPQQGRDGSRKRDGRWEARGLLGREVKIEGTLCQETQLGFAPSRDAHSIHLEIRPWKHALCLLSVWKQLGRIFFALSQSLAFAEAVWWKSSTSPPPPRLVTQCDKVS